MRKWILLIMIMCVCLTGCSSGSVTEDVHVQFDGTSFKVEGKDLPLTKYTGTSAMWQNNGATIKISLEQIDDLAYAALNTQSIMVEDMDIYQKKAYTWSLYLGTQSVMYYPYWESKDNAKYWMAMHGEECSEQQAFAYMWDIAKSLKMTEGQVFVECGDDMVFANEFNQINVTNEYASISGMINIKKYQKPECTEPFTVVQNEKDTFTLMKWDSEQYTYYQYKDWVIQTVLGIDLTEYITFK